MWIFQETSIVRSKQQPWFNKALKQTLNFKHALNTGFGGALTYVLLYKERLKYVLTVKLVLKCFVELGPMLQLCLCLPDTNCVWHAGNSSRGCYVHLPAFLFPSDSGCIGCAARLGGGVRPPQAPSCPNHPPPFGSPMSQCPWGHLWRDQETVTFVTLYEDPT